SGEREFVRIGLAVSSVLDGGGGAVAVGEAVGGGAISRGGSDDVVSGRVPDSDSRATATELGVADAVRHDSRVANLHAGDDWCGACEHLGGVFDQLQISGVGVGGCADAADPVLVHCFSRAGFGYVPR